MTQLVYITLFGWIPFFLALFVVLPPERAVAFGVVGGWLLLPPTSIPVSGLPDYDKNAAITGAIFLATLIFQPNRLLGLRWRWFDLLVFCASTCPMISSLQNGLGVYDGLSACLGAVVRMALPYLIGRIYLDNLDSLREFAVVMVICGMLYVIPTVYEIRMSPTLRLTVYGIWSHFWATRLGGYRPFVFLNNGLEHGMWMSIASVLAVWLWRAGTLRRIGFLPMGGVLLPCLLIVTLLCRSSGALFLLVAGLLILWASTAFRTKLLVYALLLVAPTYYALRIPNLWSGEDLVGLIRTYYNEERAHSLEFRFNCENMLTVKALEQPIWGWAGWGRSRITGPDGKDLAPTDGMWIIFLGQYGFVGLLLWTASLIVPALSFVHRFPVARWTEPSVAPAAALAVLLGLYQVDCLVNGFLQLTLVTATGGLICVSHRQYRWGAVEEAEDPPGEPEGIEAYGDAGRCSPQVQLADRYVKLAKGLRARGSMDEARAAVSHALDLLNSSPAEDPRSRGGHEARWDCINDIAWLLLNEPGPPADDHRLAVTLATQAVQADSQCAAYWNTLGAALLRVGDPESAANSIDRSMALGEGGTAFDFLVLAIAHAQLGDEHLAREWYARARSWMRDHPPQPDLLRLDGEASAHLDSRFGSAG